MRHLVEPRFAIVEAGTIDRTVIDDRAHLVQNHALLVEGDVRGPENGADQMCHAFASITSNLNRAKMLGNVFLARAIAASKLRCSSKRMTLFDPRRVSTDRSQNAAAVQAPRW